MMRLRVHHLFCSALYVGKGYSEAFCRNMQKVVTWLWAPSSGPDEICRECPNLGDKGCKLDNDHVVSKDAALAQALGLEVERVYPIAELLHIVSGNLTAEIFENSCHNCDWYAQGLCRYEQLAEKYRRC